MHYATDMVKVYDVNGKAISTKKLPELLKKEMVALASTDPQAAEPLNLRLFKEGTLLFILPPLLSQPPPAVVEARPTPIVPPPAATSEPPLPAPSYPDK
jgi:hypothetical protein